MMGDAVGVRRWSWVERVQARLHRIGRDGLGGGTAITNGAETRVVLINGPARVTHMLASAGCFFAFYMGVHYQATHLRPHHHRPIYQGIYV